MFKHILIPSDGSELADKAVQAGLRFAKWADARVTAFTAVPEYRVPSQGELMAGSGVSVEEYERDAKAKAQSILDGIAARAREAGVDFDSELAFSDHPWSAIIDTAQAHGCDLIFMASHGRRGFSAFIHGSETREVLTHSKIPTLVYR